MIVNSIKDFLHAKNQLKKFRTLSAQQKKIVFYSEGKNYWTYFEKIINYLIKKNVTIIYLTSDADDSILTNSTSNIHSFYIGKGSIRTICFATMEAKLVLMTMPDLDTSYIKKSPNVENYIYIHHSIVSQHMVYNENAFDNYDTIFCVGKHHFNENLVRQKNKKILKKELVEHGYGRLDQLLEDIEKNCAPLKKGKKSNKKINVLIAPSWGINGVVERKGEKLVEILLKNDFIVTLRPHPQTIKNNLSLINKIVDMFSERKNFNLDTNMNATLSLQSADIMISDWSGAAYEFSFSRLKPVLFIDVPLKINNANYEDYNIVPIEVSLRDQIGTILPEEEIFKLPETISKMVRDVDKWKEKIIELRKDTIFNIGKSGEVAGDWIISKLSN
jgi:hypothetical protein